MNNFFYLSIILSIMLSNFSYTQILKPLDKEGEDSILTEETNYEMELVFEDENIIWAIEFFEDNSILATVKSGSIFHYKNLASIQPYFINKRAIDPGRSCWPVPPAWRYDPPAWSSWPSAPWAPPSRLSMSPSWILKSHFRFEARRSRYPFLSSTPWCLPQLSPQKYCSRRIWHQSHTGHPKFLILTMESGVLYSVQ